MSTLDQWMSGAALRAWRPPPGPMPRAMVKYQAVTRVPTTSGMNEMRMIHSDGSSEGVHYSNEFIMILVIGSVLVKSERPVTVDPLNQ